MALSLLPLNALAKLDTGHKIDVTFTVLYVGDEFRIGYNYGSSEKTQFVCQYSTPHSDTAYTNHTIAISDIKAAAGRATVDSGYQIVGWSKESNANPTTWSLNKSGTTACNKGTTIYLVAKNPNPITKYTYTLVYDANGGTGAPSADSWSTTDSATRTHTFAIKDTVPTREGYVFKGWKGRTRFTTVTAQKEPPHVPYRNMAMMLSRMAILGRELCMLCGERMPLLIPLSPAKRISKTCWLKTW